MRRAPAIARVVSALAVVGGFATLIGVLIMLYQGGVVADETATEGGITAGQVVMGVLGLGLIGFGVAGWLVTADLMARRSDSHPR